MMLCSPPSKRLRTDDEASKELGATSGEAKLVKPLRKYDVFINHRGPDTKKKIVAHLRQALCNAGYYPFLDAKAIGQGRHVFDSINEALHGACVHVAVFSKRYAESKYCLQELYDMLQTKKVILPVFYGVEPEHLRYTDSGPFADGFQKHLMRGRLEHIGKWKEALREVAELRGFRLDEVSWDEQQLVQSIVDEVRNQMPLNLQPMEHRFGLQEPLREVLEKLDSMGDTVGIIGLFGMGGIGKTTLADEVYRHLRTRGSFKASFLTDVRSSVPLELQRQLVYDLLQHDMGRSTHAYREWFPRFGTQRVLLVVDDIDNVKQFTNLIRDILQFYPGSRIVVTSRHRDVLNYSMGPASHKALYEVKELNSIYSRKIFNWHAFCCEDPSSEFRDLAEKVADACGGILLALEVIGASLFDKRDFEADVPVWEDTIKTLKENGDILDKLRISYNSLPTDGDRSVFRDIACLLIGMRKEVALEIWTSCHSCSDYCSTSKGPHLVLRRLMDKSLVRLRDGELSMHDLIRDMGRDVVIKEVKKELPGKRTHLWDLGTAKKVVRQNQGTDRVRGLSLSEGDIYSTPTHATVEFTSVQELHLLVLDGCALVCDDSLTSCLQELRWLQWRGLPCTELPFNLKLPKLTVFDVSDSINLSRLWQEDAHIEFPWLQRLILNNCRLLEELPQSIGHKIPRVRTMEMKDCSLIPILPDSIDQLKYLEHLILSGCESLKTLPDSISQLKNLQHLILSSCRNLTTLPNAIVKLTKLKKIMLDLCERMTHLPEELGALMNLEELNLYGCKGLRELPLSIRELRRLKELDIDETTFESLPDGFGQYLTCLHTLHMSKVLTRLPQSFEGLKGLVSLDIHGRVSGLEGRLPSYFGAFIALKTLDLQGAHLVVVEALLQSLQHFNMYGCKKLMHLPSLAELSSLRYLNLAYCRSLLDIHGLEFLTTLEEIDLVGCTSLVSSKLQIVQNNSTLRRCCLSGSNVVVPYTNTWLEKEPASQLIMYYGNSMGFLLNGMAQKIDHIEWYKELVVDATISSKAECIAVIICVVMCDLGSTLSDCSLEVRITRGNMELMNDTFLEKFYYVGDDRNQVYLLTCRRQHILVQSLKYADKICVNVRFDKRRHDSIRVEEGAICVIHAERDEQVTFINSKMLDKSQSKEWSTMMGKLMLGDNAHPSMLESLQDLEYRERDAEMHDSEDGNIVQKGHLHHHEVFEQQRSWTIPPVHGQLIPSFASCWMLPRDGRGIISFSAEGSSDIEISILGGDDAYLIIIGGNGNLSTCIRKGYLSCEYDVSVVERGLLYPEFLNRLWVSLDEATSIIQVGRGEPYQNIISHYMDPYFISDAQRVSFTTNKVPITYSNIKIMDLDQHIQEFDIPYQLQGTIHNLEIVMNNHLTIVPRHGDFNWDQYWKLQSMGRGILSFTVEDDNDIKVIHIAISARPCDVDPMYEIVL